MTERDFIYWLNGFLELANPNTLNSTQVQIIKDHIKLVMKKETPDRTPLLKAAEKRREAELGDMVRTKPPQIYNDCLFCGEKGGHSGLSCPYTVATC